MSKHEPDTNLVSLSGAPRGREVLSAMWFTRTDWDEMVAAQERMADRGGQRHYLDYRVTERWIPHPSIEGSGGYVAVYEPGWRERVKESAA